MQTTPRYLQPEPYRNAATFITIIGSYLLWKYSAEQDIEALAAILLLFVGALAGMITILLALRVRDGGTAIQGVLLVLWQIGFPLVLLTQLYHHAG